MINIIGSIDIENHAAGESIEEDDIVKSMYSNTPVQRRTDGGGRRLFDKVMDQNHGQMMMQLMYWKVGGWQAIYIYTTPRQGRNRCEIGARHTPDGCLDDDV